MQGKQKQLGTAATELALMMGVLLLIMMGAMDFSRLFFSAVTVVDASRAGVQYGSQSNALTGDFNGMNSAATNNAGDLPEASATSERYCKCESGNEVDCVTGSCPEGVPQIYVRVDTQSSFQTMVQFPGLPHDVPLGKSATFRVQ